jgi:integrase
LGDLRLSALSPMDIERYKKTRTLPAPGRRGTGTTITNREIGLLSAVIDRCKDWGLTTRPDNPCKKVKRFRESRGRERILTYAEEDALLAALPEPHRTVTQLAIECGGRLQSELLPVTWDDVDLDKARLTITATHAKNGRARHVPMSPDMVSRLAAMKQTSTSPLVFPAAGGGRLHKFKDRYFKAVEAVGLKGTKLGIHSLRHTWASRMIEAGADLSLVQQLGGWSSLLMVTRYSHHRPERAVDATAAMLAARAARPESPHATPRPLARVPRNA